MPQKKSPRNKTIELEDIDIQVLSKNLVTLNSKVEIEDILNRTICQNTFEALDYLPDAFVDLLFVDPPYNMNKIFGEQSFKRIQSDSYEEWVNSWMKKIHPKLKPNASIYVCGDWFSSTTLFRVLSQYFEIQNRITWEREKGRGAKTNWKNASEDIWFATVSPNYYFNVDAVKLKKRVIAPYRDNVGKPKDWDEEENGNFRLTYPSNLWTDISVPFWSMPENTTHPTQKPEKLLAKIILASSQEGDIVLDPFLGSGTTSVVAKKLGRNYVGIELDKYYACVAEQRLALVGVDNRIQGYSDGVFWERNIAPDTLLKTKSKQRKLF